MERRSCAERDLVVEPRLRRSDGRVEHVVLHDAPRVHGVLHRVGVREREPGVVEEHDSVRPALDLGAAAPAPTVAGDGEVDCLDAAVDRDLPGLRDRNRVAPRPASHPAVRGHGVLPGLEAPENDPSHVARGDDLADATDLAARRVLDDVDELRLRRHLARGADCDPSGVSDAGHRDGSSHREENEGLERTPEQTLGLVGHSNPLMGAYLRPLPHPLRAWNRIFGRIDTSIQYKKSQ